MIFLLLFYYSTEEIDVPMEVEEGEIDKKEELGVPEYTAELE